MNRINMSDAHYSLVHLEGKKMPPECGNTRRGLTNPTEMESDMATPIIARQQVSA